MTAFVQRGDLKEAYKIHVEIFEINQSIFYDTNPIPLRYMMSRLGLLDAPELRLPLVSIDPAKAALLDSVLQRAGLLSTSYTQR